MFALSNEEVWQKTEGCIKKHQDEERHMQFIPSGKEFYEIGAIEQIKPLGIFKLDASHFLPSASPDKSSFHSSKKEISKSDINVTKENGIRQNFAQSVTVESDPILGYSKDLNSGSTHPLN